MLLNDKDEDEKVADLAERVEPTNRIWIRDV